MALLELKDISKAYYGNTVLEGIDLSVSKGSILGILGVNGSGKTTLVRLLSGDILPQAGEIFFNGRSISPKDPHDAISMGIRTIHQGSQLIGGLTVAENTFIFGYDHSSRLLKRYSVGKMADMAGELFGEYGIDVNPYARAEMLSAVSAQLVKIAAAMSERPELLVIDEPFNMLTSAECDSVSSLLDRIRKQGTSIIITTANILKTIELCDDIAILKEGRLISAQRDRLRDAEYYINEISETAKFRYPRISNTKKRRVLSLKKVGGDTQLSDISFDMYSGEILGVAGAPGAGKSTLARMIFGAHRIKTGEMFVEGRPCRFREPSDAVDRGIGMISGNSENGGIILDFSIKQNITLAGIEHVSRFGVIQNAAENENAGRYIKKYGITPPNAEAKAYAMSEGQRQKVVFCKWMLKGCKILVMDNATRGMDISSKVELYNFMNSFAMNGGSILFISTDYNELMGMCDRLLVLNSGHLTGELERSDFSMLKIVDMLSK